TINGTSYTLIHSMAQLAALDDATGTATGNFAIAQNLDAAGTTYTNSPILILSGTLAGLGHTISNLTINAPTTANVGLLRRSLVGTTFRDLGLVNANVTGRGSVGALLGQGALGADATTIRNVYATGSVTATGRATPTGNPTSGNGQRAGGL